MATKINNGIKYVPFDNRKSLQSLATKNVGRTISPNTTVGKIMHSRLGTARDHCLVAIKNVGLSTYLLHGYALTYPPKNMVYCITPKVGCTFWKRIFRFLNKDYVGEPKNPFDITRMFSHFGPINHMEKIDLTPGNITILARNFTFTFVRDPYARLWSAYVDKFLLPDFWVAFGKNIVAQNRPNATQKSLKCGHDVSFREFLQHILNRIKLGRRVSSHYLPIHQLCSPCHIHFDAIGKLETFKQDVDYILRRLGLSFLMENYTFQTHEEDEIVTLIDYNFWLEKRLPEECFDPVTIAERLWKALQLKGYLDETETFPEDSMKHLNKPETIRQELKDRVFKSLYARRSPDRHWMTRRKWLVEGYKPVSNFVLKELLEVFQYDFEMFGYQKKPADIFEGRYL
ncbi:hypothetical protein CHS0354_039664 [Potamilus streckersoni]|uniref:Carbohydrate sulfotransferase n=1 Tax=Potamilus streckersoni TaxID=2493646 RepID=A0AAE0SK38_9BIVA|nr:hypothetical protein CHS0354_039664 [Potamilus streckersoni]